MIFRLIAVCLLLYCGGSTAATQTARWGAEYFPNVLLTTQHGRQVRFFDDLIEGRIVAINFIYTRCVDVCPLETAGLIKVQELLGERLGKDIFFYSISIDPQHDTPAVLREYARRFGARWDFLHGSEADVIRLRRKLGLYIEEIQDGSDNHNATMIIGNQASGRWMKRSPFENPYVLADQLGSWLDDWKSPTQGGAGDYAAAPRLRRIGDGERLFRSRCASCHSVDGRRDDDAIGPDLQGVTRKRERQWLVDWLRDPERMLARGDPTARALYERYDRVVMPNLRLSRNDIAALLDYLDQTAARTVADASADVVAVGNAWVRACSADAKATAAYMTLVNLGTETLHLSAVESEVFGRIELHEMTTVDGLPRMRQIARPTIAPGGRLRLAPGGKHLMLMGPRRALGEGERLSLRLRFESGAVQTVSAAVLRQP